MLQNLQGKYAHLKILSTFWDSRKRKVKLRGQVYSPDKPQFRIILVLLLFQKFPGAAIGRKESHSLHLTKLLSVVNLGIRKFLQK